MLCSGCSLPLRAGDLWQKRTTAGDSWSVWHLSELEHLLRDQGGGMAKDCHECRVCLSFGHVDINGARTRDKQRLLICDLLIYFKIRKKLIKNNDSLPFRA